MEEGPFAAARGILLALMLGGLFWILCGILFLWFRG
jgi:hypothetical protein